MRLINLRRDLREAQAELDDVYSMSDEAACFRYMVDTKEEAIRIIEEDIEYMQSQIAELETTENREYAGWCDPAFRSIGDFDRLRT